MNKRLLKDWDEYPEMLRRERMYSVMLEQLAAENFEEELQAVRNNPIMSAEIKISIEENIKRRQMAHSFEREMCSERLQQDRTQLALFESALQALPERLRDIARELAVGEISWDLISEKHYISRTTLSHYRKQILEILSEIYDRHERAEINRLLS